MSNKNNTKNNPEVKPETTTKIDLLELVKLADARKALEAQIAAQSNTIKSEIERINGEIEKLQAEKAELLKLTGQAGISTGHRGRPAGSKNKPKDGKTAETAQAPVNAETAKTLEILKGGVESGNAPVANIETMPQGESVNVAQVA